MNDASDGRLEAIIWYKLSIHLVRESAHLSESRNFTIYGCGIKSSLTLRTEKPITLITFNMTFMWTFHTNLLLNGYMFHACCVHE